MPEKTIAIRIDEELHKKIKMRLVQNGMTLKDYVVQLINNDLADAEMLKLKAVPINSSVSEESIQEAQKILDFVSGIISNNK